MNRFVKINNLIVNETDAKGYHTFYTDYFGTGSLSHCKSSRV